MNVKKPGEHIIVMKLRRGQIMRREYDGGGEGREEEREEKKRRKHAANAGIQSMEMEVCVCQGEIKQDRAALNNACLEVHSVGKNCVRRIGKSIWYTSN